MLYMTFIMQIISPSYLKKIFREHSLLEIFKTGFAYGRDYFLHGLFTPVYVQKVQSLPASMSSEEILAFVENDCRRALAPLQVHSEIVQLLEHVKTTQPKVVVEIGTANGGTLLSLVKVCPSDTEFVSIDLPAGEFGGGYAWYKIPLFKAFVKPPQKITLLRADSHAHSTREQLETILDGRKIDVLFIDGDHTYEGVKQDFLLYSPLVKNGGSIAFHDIVPHAKALNCEVDRFWNEVSHQYPNQTFVENWQQGVCGIGIITFQSKPQPIKKSVPKKKKKAKKKTKHRR